MSSTSVNIEIYSEPNESEFDFKGTVNNGNSKTVGISSNSNIYILVEPLSSVNTYEIRVTGGNKG